MPASFVPITPELLTDFRAGKEPALEQLFRQNFEALTAEAAERLEDVAAAQKVVALSFLEVWDRRAASAAPSQLEAQVRQAVNGGVSHEMRRRAAAHRLADTDGDHTQHAAKHAVAPETTDQVWAKIAAELHAPKPDRAARAQEAGAHQRHEAASHIAKVSKRSNSKMASIAFFVVVVGVGATLWFLNKGAETTKAGQLLIREDANIMKSSPGQRGKVNLEDSTEVRIGSASTIKMTAHFPMDMRALQVMGTAAFKTPKANTPLLVKVSEAWVYASDADFVVRSFPDDSGTAMIKATKGTISVKSGKEERELAAGSAVQVLQNGVFMDLDPSKAALAFGWVDGSFVTDNAPLRRVLAELKRWYGLDIAAKDTSILGRPVSMTSSLESNNDAIKALEAAAAVKVTYEGKNMIMIDAAKAPVAKAPVAKKK